jgi:hypothetical protein
MNLGVRRSITLVAKQFRVIMASPLYTILINYRVKHTAEDEGFILPNLGNSPFFR